MSNKLQIKKISDSGSNIYPLSVCESVVTTHQITVRNNIGKYKTNDTIPAVTTLDEIVTNILTGTGSQTVIIDNETLVQNSLGAIKVNFDKVVSTQTNQTITGTKTFKSINYSESVIPEVKRQVIDPNPDGSFIIPDGLPELPESGEIDTGTYVLSSNRNTGIVIKENATVKLYVYPNVIVNSDTDGVYIKTGAILHLYNKGTISALTESDQKCAIFNEGKCFIKGGTYKVGLNGKCYYAILNHGELLETWDINVSVNSGNASLLVNGYYYYTTGTDRSYISEGKGSLTPKCIIHSGTYFNNSSTGTLKNDGGGTMIIYDGTFSGIGGQCLQNSGVHCEIHGGTWSKDPSSPTRLIYDGSDIENEPEGRNCELIITGGRFICNGEYWLWLDFKPKTVVKPQIKGGIFGIITNYVFDSYVSGGKTYPLVLNQPFSDLVDSNSITINVDGYIYVYDKTYLLPLLNGITFNDGNIKSTNEGIVINGIKNIGDETSAVNKKYVDSLAISKFDYTDNFNLTTESGRISAIKSILLKLGAKETSIITE